MVDGNGIHVLFSSDERAIGNERLSSFACIKGGATGRLFFISRVFVTCLEGTNWGCSSVGYVLILSMYREC